MTRNVITVTSPVTAVRLLKLYRVGPPSKRNASNQPFMAATGPLKPKKLQTSVCAWAKCENSVHLDHLEGWRKFHTVTATSNQSKFLLAMTRPTCNICGLMAVTVVIFARGPPPKVMVKSRTCGGTLMASMALFIGVCAWQGPSLDDLAFGNTLVA